MSSSSSTRPLNPAAQPYYAPTKNPYSQQTIYSQPLLPQPPPPPPLPPPAKQWWFPPQPSTIQHNLGRSFYQATVIYPYETHSESQQQLYNQYHPQCDHVIELNVGGTAAAADGGGEEFSEDACGGGGGMEKKGVMRIVSYRPRPLRGSFCMRQGRPKNSDFASTTTSSFNCDHEGGVFDTDGSGLEKTTIMMRNIPSPYRRTVFLAFLDRLCREENQKTSSQSQQLLMEYDFVYLPMDFRRGKNLGYAFINFTSAMAAKRVTELLHKTQWNIFESRKICEITWAYIQGKEELLQHFKSTDFLCASPDYLPVVFSPPRNGFSSFTRPRIVGLLRGLAP